MSADPKRVISLSSLSSGPNVIFHESSYFSRNPGQPFPTLSEIQKESAHQHSASSHDSCNPPPVLFESLGLLVKYGQTRVRVAEGQSLWALKLFLPRVPVPEIYGWATECGYVILYMELVKGVTVEKRWPSMTDDEKTGFWKAFRAVFDDLRKLSQDPNDRFVAIDTPKDPRPGPFASVKDFHDWWSITIRTGAEIHWPGMRPEELPDPYRAMVPDDAAIVFTHAELHCSNIIVDLENPSTIIAIDNWHYSGWWPDYWEFCKTQYVYEPGPDWNRYMNEFLEEPDEVTQDGFHSYIRAMGN